MILLLTGNLTMLIILIVHAAIDKDLTKLKKDAEVLRDNLLLSRLTNIVSDKI